MPIIHKQNLANGIRFAIWKIDESLDELIQLSRKPTERREAIKEFQHDRRRFEYIATRLLIEHLTSTDADIKYLPSGKPTLADNSFQISLSHTAGYAAAIVHPAHYVGIDIEAISPRIMKIKEKFLSTKELESIDSTREVNHLLLCWSAKETVYKAMSEEDVDFKTQMQIVPFIPLEAGIFTIHEYRTSAQRSYPISYFVSDDYVMTWTV